MQLRCTYCQTMFSINQEEMLAGLEHMEEQKQSYYDAHCPKCRRANRVERFRMERAFPDWKKAIKTMAKESAQTDKAGADKAGREKEDMTIRAVYFDLGGVIVRTEFQAPRQHLAERFGMDYDDLIKLVFDSPSARDASVGRITEDEHWAAVTRALHLPESDTPAIRNDFFGGDVTDIKLVDFMRELRNQYKVGLISNAWSGLRAWIVSEKFDDAFDAMTISAEAGVMKPDPAIYQIANQALGVSPQEAVFLDDFLENVQAARAFGMAAIHFEQPELALKKLQLLLADHHL